MDATTTAYEWGLKWVLQRGALSLTEEERYNLVEEVMRDWDIKEGREGYPILTDSQWEDVCYCIRDELSERLEEV